MKRFRVTLTLAAAFCGVASADDIPLRDWNVPGSSGIQTLTDITNPLPFIGVTPCRIVDTRGNGAPLQGGKLVAGVRRDYALGGHCNIPTSAAAISVNVTVTNTAGPGMILLWPLGGTQPTVSTLNYVAGQTIANAAIVPMSSGTVSVVAGVHGTDLIIDTNGYFSVVPAPGTGGFQVIIDSPTAWAGLFENDSLTCVGNCGLVGSTHSTQAGATAIEGFAPGLAAPNYGVHGIASGTGGGYPPMSFNYSAGVYGMATNASANVAGVTGETISSGSYADGVLGLASVASANAGQFYNSGNSRNVYLATGIYGLSSNGAVGGTALYISGLPKNFVAPHPLDPSKQIVYAAIEGPSADVFFRGTAHLVNGSALIQVPEHFRLTAREDSYMATVTAFGERSTLWVESQGPDGIVVKGTGNAAFNYVVYAERDETRDQQPVRENTYFVPEQLAKLGLLKTLPARTIALLVKNGTLNEDGTFNEATARRLGWTLPPRDSAVPPTVGSSGTP